ncbi:MAG: Uma2 family endonuclease [Pseudomonadota bacterium]
MSALAEHGLATYADIEALPSNMTGEIVRGVLHAHPRPLPRHAVASFRIAGQLDSPFQRGRGGPGGWIFMNEPELHLGHAPEVLVPDLAGWRRETLPVIPQTVGITTPPNWVCEVLSPSTARLDRTIKLKVYADYGVGHAWYIDPDARTLEVFELVGQRWQLAATVAPGALVTAPPFEAHTFALDVLWGEADGDSEADTAE